MIKTKASLARQINDKTDFQLIKEEGPRKLPKNRKPKVEEKKHSDESSEDSEFERVFGDGPKRKKPKNKKNELTYESARREILNFGISGHQANAKIDLSQQLAIKLGAKPPKREGRNYKEMLEEKRKQKEDDSKVNKRILFGTSASMTAQKRNHRRDGLLKRYGKVEQRDREENQNTNTRKRKR